MALLSGLLSLLGCFSSGSAAAEKAAEPLRLCADPANLPFSSANPETPGLYLEIGNAIGRAIGRPVAPVWSLTYFGKRALRTTLLAGKCDAAIGLPQDADFMGPKLIFSKPVLRVGYALVFRGPRTVTSLDDLAGSRVAVQFATTPQSLLAYRDDILTVTFREPEDAMAALAQGQVDAAFIWGPTAGYLNKTTYAGAFSIVPVEGHGLLWAAAIGFARGQKALREQVDRAIDDVAGEIEALAIKYGVPQEPRIKLREAENPPRAVLVADGRQEGTAPPTMPADNPAEETSGASDQAAEIAHGREFFNGTCAHCHGPDAVVAERRVNLRLMKRRYGDKMDETFMYVVTHGRPDKGMPDWTGVLDNDQFTKILTFLHSVQTR